MSNSACRKAAGNKIGGAWDDIVARARNSGTASHFADDFSETGIRRSSDNIAENAGAGGRVSLDETGINAPLGLPSPTHNVPDGYTVKISSNGEATVTGPRGGEYRSTGFYDGNGNQIYRGNSGEYVTLYGARTVVNAPPDYSSIPLHHICTNKCSVGQNGQIAWTPKYQEFFDRADLNIDKATENLVAVPGRRGPHPDAYHQYVFGSLDDATRGFTPNTPEYKNAVTNTLNQIKREALTPGSKVNDLLTGQ